MHEAEEVIGEVLASGARACVVKSDLEDLVAAVRNLLPGCPSYTVPCPAISEDC
jgi:DNA-binding NarL/FixJ family response regulator